MASLGFRESDLRYVSYTFLATSFGIETIAIFLDSCERNSHWIIKESSQHLVIKSLLINHRVCDWSSAKLPLC